MFHIFFQSHYNNKSGGDLVQIENCIAHAYSRIKWFIGDVKSLGEIATNAEEPVAPDYDAPRELPDRLHKFVNTTPLAWLRQSAYEDQQYIVVSWFRGLSKRQYNKPQNVKIGFNKAPIGNAMN